MEEILINPLKEIFKINDGEISQELENPFKIPIFFEYLNDKKIKEKDKIIIIEKIISIFGINRRICVFFSIYQNKSIYLFLIKLYIDQGTSQNLKQALINFISVLRKNIQINKDVYEFIFQNFSNLYRKNESIFSNENRSKNFFDLLILLNSLITYFDTEKPKNYFSCYGGNFGVYFNEKPFEFGNGLAIMLNFKISNSDIMSNEKNSLGICNLVKINFNGDKVFAIDLKSLFISVNNIQNPIILCPPNEWINLNITLTIENGNFCFYLFIDGGNSKKPYVIKNLEITKVDTINSIIFFNNFYGEVTSINVLSIKNSDKFFIFSREFLKDNSIYNEGIYNLKSLNRYLKCMEKLKLYYKIICLFTPMNYDNNYPNIVEDCLFDNKLVIDGNIRNNKYKCYQKNLGEIIDINNFLPIAEMFILYPELLTEKNLLLYLDIILNLLKFGKLILKEMNDSNFFILFALYLEKFPNYIFNENLCKKINLIGRVIIRNDIENNFPVQFFDNVLLNPVIISKYSKEVQIQFWNLILKFCEADPFQLESFNLEKICLILRSYDHNKYNEMCCENHLKMFKNEFMGNKKYMQPSLSERICHIKNILEVILFIQSPEKVMPIFRLLMLDLSPCLTKVLLNVFQNLLEKTNKNEEWKNKLIDILINNKYEIIIINCFKYAFPDVRYEILKFMNIFFMRLVRLNKLDKFTTFEKMIKTCLLPEDMFYISKKEYEDLKYKNNNNKINIDNKINAITKINDKKEENNEDKKNIINSNTISNNIKLFSTKPEKKIERKSIILDHINSNTKEKTQSILGAIEAKILQQKEQEDFRQTLLRKKGVSDKNIINIKVKSDNIMNKILKFDMKLKNNNEVQNNKQISNNNDINNNQINNDINDNNTNNNVNINNKNNSDQNNNIINTINNDEENFFCEKDKIFILRDEIYNKYLADLYNILLKWSLGIRIDINSESACISMTEIPKISLEQKFITNITIMDLFFALNNYLNNINFTLKILRCFEELIKSPENSFLILSNKKIYSSLLDITFNYFINENNKEKECYKIGKSLLINVFIKSLIYLQGAKEHHPMINLEILFTWGERIILYNINDQNKKDNLLDFLYEILLDLLSEFKFQFEPKMKFEFDDKLLNPKKNYYLKNYLIFLTYIYNFIYHYKIDPVIKNSEVDSFNSASLNINIPEIFISGMRIDYKKGNDLFYYWKDYSLIYDVLNKIKYVWSSEYLYKKLVGEEYENSKKNSAKLKKDIRNEFKEDNKYIKAEKILKNFIINKDKKNMFKKELYILCYEEKDQQNNIEIIISLIKIASISLICILTIEKDTNDEKEFKYWLKEYKNLIKFMIISSSNLEKINPNSADYKIMLYIQNTCFDVISSGLCFLNNLLSCCTMCKEKIEKSIKSIFILCFTIIKYQLSNAMKSKKKLAFFQKVNDDLSTSALCILFNEYYKDKLTNTPFINLNNIENIYLNQSQDLLKLINNDDFYAVFFENENLKKKLNEKYYSINLYKRVVDLRYSLLPTLEDKVDYSYQKDIFNLLPIYEKELQELSNSVAKNQKIRKNLYKKYKKLIFSWNGMWSNRDLFFENMDSNKIKFKIINHYSKSFMKPLIAPILDLDFYLAKFTNFEKEKLFNKNINKNDQDTNNYFDLILSIDKIFEITQKNKNNTNNNINSNLIIENIKENESDENKNYLKQIYLKLDPKLYQKYLKISSNFQGNKNEKNNTNPQNNSNISENKNNSSDINNNNNGNSKTNITMTFYSDFNEMKRLNTIAINDSESDQIFIFNNINYYLCCLVKTTHHIKGVFSLENNSLNFRIFSNQKEGKEMDGIEIEFNNSDDDYDSVRLTCFGSYFTYRPKDKNTFNKSVNYDNIKMVLKRRYYYKNSAIEIFTSTNKAYYFNFKNEIDRENILNEMINKLKEPIKIINDLKDSSNMKNNIIGYINQNNISYNLKTITKNKKIIKLSTIITRWQNWEITNYELLILLNLFSNRSYNDLSQYPIFPWPLSDYEDPLKKEKIIMNDDNELIESKNENINSASNIIEDYSYRDLSLPMGMLEINEVSIKRKKTFLKLYKTTKKDEDSPPYFYGCNYSNPTYVSNYLIRLFPFTEIHIELQGTGFDSSSRLFNSIDKTFQSCIGQTTDVRELIPEFYYLPEMFLNLNNLNLGKIDNNIPVNDVITPCNNNPYEFVHIMKNVLESENISYNINNWIDLFFGYKVKGKEAENAKNIFRDYSYQEDINLNEIINKADYLRCIEFGLIPNQLFSKEFPEKEKIEDIKKINEITDYSFNLKKLNTKNLNKEINETKENSFLLKIAFIAPDRISFVYNSNLFIEKKISCNEKIYSEEILNIIILPQITNKMSKYFNPIIYNNNAIQIINKGKTFIMGGFYDGKIIIVSSEIETETNSNFKMIDLFPLKDKSPVSVISVDKDEEFLFIGNEMGNIAIFSITNKINNYKKIYTITDNKSAISHISCNNELNVWASATEDGYINVYTLPLCKLTKSIKLDINSKCNYVFISDSPLPSLIIICEDEILIYSINGFFIYKLKEYSIITNPIIFKDFYKNDYLAYVINEKDVSIRNIPGLSVTSSFVNEKDIFYICPSEDLKLLYLVNKNGTQVDVVKCDLNKDS